MHTVTAPSHICIYHHITIGNATAEFLDLLLAVGHKGPFTLDLRDTKYVSAAAALMLFAHVNFLQLLYGSRDRVRCLFPSRKKNPEGHQSVVGTQLARALTSGSLDALEKLVADKVFFQSSNDVNAHAAITVSQLTEKLELAEDDELLQMLGSAIGEAMLNVKHHAYAHNPEVFTGNLASRWWQYARFDAEQGDFTFLIYDLGLGILKSYKSSVDTPKADKHLLEEALSFGYSRFSATHPNRGCGSEDLKHPINCGETLLICCDDLRYIYKGDPDTAKIERTVFELHGSLVEWTLKTADAQKEAP
jgi:hypothetical protein